MKYFQAVYEGHTLAILDRLSERFQLHKVVFVANMFAERVQLKTSGRQGLRIHCGSSFIELACSSSKENHQPFLIPTSYERC